MNVSPRHRTLLIGTILALAAFSVYFQLLNHDFINYDDDLYITANIHVRTGLRLENVVWAFTTGHGGNWHPLTWISHMLDAQLYGLNAWGHHLTNLLFHIANTVLLFVVLRRMTAAVWQSAFVAALFAFHPLHVESVAWVAERKDVLSTCFWFLTMLAYVRYTEQPGTKKYSAVLLFLVLGLMAKPMLVTLPIVLLLMDYWPLRRLPSERSHDTKGQRTVLAELLKEKLPLFALAAVSGLLTFFVQQHGGGVWGFSALPLNTRIENALVAYVGYIGKMVWPSSLAVIYPHTGENPGAAQVVMSGLFLILVSGLVIRATQQRPYLAVGWFWYVVTLAPVIGLVQVGDQAMADRYTYVTLVGLFIIVAWGVPDIVSQWKYRGIALGIGGLALLLAYGVCTRAQLQYWRNSVTLFQHAVNVVPRNWVAHLNLGNAFEREEKIADAIEQYSQSVEIKPNNAKAQNNLGATLVKEGKLEEAITHLAEALRLKPDYAEAHDNIGLAYHRLGRLNEAIAHYAEGIRLNPEDAEVHFDLGVALHSRGQIEDAIQQYSQALRLKPDFVQAHYNLGVAYESVGRVADAIAQFSEAIRINPEYQEARNALEKLQSPRKRGQ